MAEMNSVERAKEAAYEWAVAQVQDKGCDNVAKVACKASDKRNGNTVCRSGPKGSISDEELNTLEVVILSFLSLLQADFHEEKRRDNIISVVQQIV